MRTEGKMSGGATIARQARRKTSTREPLFQSFTLYQHKHLRYTHGWVLAGGLSHRHHHHHHHHHHHQCHHPTQDIDAISDGSLEAGAPPHDSVVLSAEQDEVLVDSSAPFSEEGSK